MLSSDFKKQSLVIALLLILVLNSIKNRSLAALLRMK